MYSYPLFWKRIYGGDKFCNNTIWTGEDRYFSYFLNDVLKGDGSFFTVQEFQDKNRLNSHFLDICNTTKMEKWNCLHSEIRNLLLIN
jgi:hypothetical protein